VPNPLLRGFAVKVVVGPVDPAVRVVRTYGPVPPSAYGDKPRNQPDYEQASREYEAGEDVNRAFSQRNRRLSRRRALYTARI